MNTAKTESEPVGVTQTFGWSPAMEQLSFLWHELWLAADGRAVRLFILLFEPPAGVVISYRLDRCFYLLCGRAWTGLRLVAFPIFFILRMFSCRHEICFKAEIGRGLRVYHATLGLVVHAEAIVGKNCTLHGGNSIGARKRIERGELVLGDGVVLGVNACILGPVRIGDRVTIGAGAVVVSDFADDTVAVGVPAHPIR